MGYGKRIDTLCSLLTRAKVFADVGCDHGYCSEYMLKNGLCEKAILSDVSKGSLAKAESLLAPYIRAGKAESVLGDGFFGVPKDTDEVLIAGMGGSEIISILSHKTYGFMPARFVFQPMHDAEKVRRYIHEHGGYIERDFTFADGKYYEVITGGKTTDEKNNDQGYTAAEYEFGRENLRDLGEAFVSRMEKLIKNIGTYLQDSALQAESRAQLEAKRERLKGVLSGEIK